MQMNRALDIVVARYNENVDWTKQYSSALIYNKGVPDDSIVSINLPNVGREGHTYLYHIVSNWDNLAEWTVFVQGSQPHSRFNGENKRPMGHLYSNTVLDDYFEAQGSYRFVFTHTISFDLKYLRFRSGSRRYINVDRPVGQYPRGDSVDKWLHWGLNSTSLEEIRLGQNGRKFSDFWRCVLKRPDPPNGLVYFAQGAEFAVSKNAIRRNSLDYYLALLNELSMRNDPYQVWYLEFCWYYIFADQDESAVVPRDYGPFDRYLDRLIRIASRLRQLI